MNLKDVVSYVVISKEYFECCPIKYAPPYSDSFIILSVNYTLSGQRDTRPKYRILAAGGVNVNQRTSSTPHSVALPATKIRYLGSRSILKPNS